MLLSFFKNRSPAKEPDEAYGFRLDGPFSWEEASRQASGYDSEAIIRAIETAFDAISSGTAAMERDGVALPLPEYPFELISCCLRQGLRDGGRLRVLDFGGALGSGFRACRPWLDGLRSVQWAVVEQPIMAERGRAAHQTPELLFFATVDECLGAFQPNLVVLSGVLMYLDAPWDMLSRLLALKAGAFFVDRTLVASGESEITFLERVNMPAYRASYPCRALPKSRLSGCIGETYRLVQEFAPLDQAPSGLSGVEFYGSIWSVA